MTSRVSQVIHEWLGWCPDRSMAPFGKGTPWSEVTAQTLPTESGYPNDELIVDYGSTGITLGFFIGVVIGVIGIVVLFSFLMPFTKFRVVSGIILCGIILPVTIAILYRDLKSATLEIARDVLVIRRFLHLPVVIRKDEIDKMEIRDNVSPYPDWLQLVVMLVVIPASSANIIYSEYLQFVSGEITSSSFFPYLGFYISIVLFFLGSCYHTRIRSRYPKLLFLTTTKQKFVCIYGKNPEEIAGMLGRSVMTLTLDYIRKKMGWCPNANSMKTKTRADAGPPSGVGERLVKSPGPSGADRSGKPWRWEYEHTQRGTLIIVAVTAVILIILASMYFFGPVWVTVFVAGIMVVALAICSTLTVSVRDDALRIRFGPVGLIRKSWPASEIASVTTVSNPWYYGWGIRWTPHGPLYNVSGFFAVEVRLFSGKTFRIGTDEPEALFRAIEQARTKEMKNLP